MISTIHVLFIFLANGNVVTHDYPDLYSCLNAQGIITREHQIRGDNSISTMLCIEEDYRFNSLHPPPK